MRAGHVPKAIRSRNCPSLRTSHADVRLVTSSRKLLRMVEPITELPFFESVTWESAWAAECEGDHAEALELAAMLTSFGYEVRWELGAMTLHHLYSGQEMRWPTSPEGAGLVQFRLGPTV